MLQASLVITRQPSAATHLMTRRPHWSSVFSSSTPSNTLRQLTLPTKLYPWLARLLQQSLLSLSELTVAGVTSDVTGAEGVGYVCTWTTLCITSEPQVPASAWQWLPVPSDGTLTLDATQTGQSGSATVQLPLTDLVSTDRPVTVYPVCSVRVAVYVWQG